MTTDLYYTIDRILCPPFSFPATVNVMPCHRKANAGDSFCPLAIAGVHTNTEWWKQLLKTSSKLDRKVGRVQFPIYPNLKICGHDPHSLWVYWVSKQRKEYIEPVICKYREPPLPQKKVHLLDHLGFKLTNDRVPSVPQLVHRWPCTLLHWGRRWGRRLEHERCIVSVVWLRDVVLAHNVVRRTRDLAGHGVAPVVQTIQSIVIVWG